MIGATNINFLKLQDALKNGELKQLQGMNVSSENVNLFSEELMSLLGNTQNESLNLESINVNQILENLNSDKSKPSLFDNDLTKKVFDILKSQNIPINSKNIQEEISKINFDSIDKGMNHQVLPEKLGMNQLPIDTKLEKSELGLKNQQLSTSDQFLANKQVVTSKMSHPNIYGINPSLLKKAHVKGDPGIKINSDSKIDNLVLNNSKTPETLASSSSLMTFPMLLDSNKADQSIDLNQKVFQFSEIKTNNPNQIIGEISDYILQVKASKEDSVNLKVNHDDLGMLDITVKKMPGLDQESLSLAIGTQKIDGKVFFDQHSKDLISHLNSAGINVVDLKIDHTQTSPTMSSKNEFNMNDRHQSEQSFSDKNFHSEQNQRKNEQNRRQDLWEILKEKEVA